MSSVKKNLSSYISQEFRDLSEVEIGIAVSEWNSEITQPLLEGTLSTLAKFGVKEKNIITVNTPGSFELPLAAQFLCQKKMDTVICLGCVIQGETRHFDFICQAVADGIKEVSLKYNIPVVFGVLTTENQEQALARAGGKHGNKGVEAAITALKMVSLKKSLKIR